MKWRAASVVLLMLAAGLWLAAQTQAQNSAPAGNMSSIPDSGPGAEGAAAQSAVPESNPRVQRISHQLLCMCGCDQILPECTHQGSDRCLTHDKMMAEVEHRLASGESDNLILQSFVQEYGPQVLVVPPARGFNLTAWLMPIFVSLAGLTLAIVVVQRWRARGLKPATASAAGDPEKVSPELLKRAREETRDEDYS
ncbi:MAG TPA: cytochrome c-type biogenesis protein CcmH [Candidatus Dormibacteraeota bacterium]|nr:cytochrome c-type biogenesis protein CcmH [Candidatus Dormibacteraeota bacterium]